MYFIFRFDKRAASDSFRRCLEIREFHLDKDHIQVAECLFELGKSTSVDFNFILLIIVMLRNVNI